MSSSKECKMAILIYVRDNDTISKGFATEDIVLPCSGEVIADTGEVIVERILAQVEHMPEACWQGKADCDNCPVYAWRNKSFSTKGE